MATNFIPMPGWIAFNTTGDLGPLTIYTTAPGVHVFYARTPAMRPPSRRQKAVRWRFNLAAFIWAALTLAERALWAAAAAECASGITGYNLFMAWQLNRNLAMINKLLKHFPTLNIRTTRP